MLTKLIAMHETDKELRSNPALRVGNLPSAPGLEGLQTGGYMLRRSKCMNLSKFCPTYPHAGNRRGFDLISSVVPHPRAKL